MWEEEASSRGRAEGGMGRLAMGGGCRCGALRDAGREVALRGERPSKACNSECLKEKNDGRESCDAERGTGCEFAI